MSQKDIVKYYFGNVKKHLIIYLFIYDLKLNTLKTYTTFDYRK